MTETQPLKASDIALSAANITKVYRTGEVEVRALDNVSFELFRHEMVVLLGASGSGKSTLLNILGGLDLPTSGQVDFAGQDLSRATDNELTRFRRDHVGFVFQFYNLIPSLTARENVALVTEIARNPITPEDALAKDLEVVIELLSIDAVKVREGMPVRIDNWGGEKPLQGRVKRVEPFGFTKFSALGIEEQRVNVLAELLSPYSEWERLGHGYQVDASVILWEQDDVVNVPITSLFRRGEKWMLYAVVDGLVEAREITLGEKNTHIAQVLAGVEQGDTIVRYPSDQIVSGLRVKPRG